MIDGCDEGMATPIDCRAYYIDSDSYATAKSSRASCQGLRHTGSGFSVSKYLIDRSGSETEQNSSELSASGCGDGENSVVQNVTNVAPNGVATAVATGNDVSTSGRAHRRSVRGRLRRVMGKLESFLTDMKTAARDIRDIVVHIDVIADYVHRQTTSGSTHPDNATVLENTVCVSGYQHSLKSTITNEYASDADLSRDRNRNWKSTDVGTLNNDNNSVINKVEELLPETKKNDNTLSNNLADNNNNRGIYSDSTVQHFTEDLLLRRITASGQTTSAGSRARPRRTVTSAMTQTKQSALRSAAVHQVASGVRRRPEVVCTLAMPREEDVPTTGSDRSNYSGIYERDLEEILESVAKVNYHLRHRRRRQNIATCPSSYQRADKFSFRLRRPADTESDRSSSADSCYQRSDSSDSEPERKWSSEDELQSDDEPTADAFNRASFFRRLNRFLLDGDTGSQLPAIEP